MHTKKLFSLLMAALMLAAVMPANAVTGERAASKLGTGVQPEEDTGLIVTDGKLSQEDSEPERQLSDHGSYRISYYPHDDGAYYGDYIIIYNPDITDNTGKSTGTLNGLIETSVTEHLDTTKGEECEEEQLCEDDCMFCGTPDIMEEEGFDDTTLFADEPQGERISYSVGSTRDFKVSQSPISSSTINFTCLAVGDHCYVWTPSDKTTTVLYPLDQIDPGYADTYASEFDAKFSLMQSSFGDHWNGTQGDGKVHLVFYNINNDSWNGFFSQNDFSNNGVPMVNIDTYPAILDYSGTVNPASKMFRTIVHEYQHLIHYSVCRANDKNDESWLTEMMSAASEEICYPGSCLNGRIPNWLGKGSNTYPYSDPYFERRNFMYYSTSGKHNLYEWTNQSNTYDSFSQYGLVALYSQFLYTHLGGNTVFKTILDQYATHADYTTSNAIAAVVSSSAGATYNNRLDTFNSAFWAALVANPAEGYSESPGLYDTYGFKLQEGYDGSLYHGLSNIYDLLCPLVYTGTSSGDFARTIKGGMSLVVKPVNGRFVPPSDADSGFWYIAVFTNERLHYETVTGELETCVFNNRGYPFMPVDGAAKSTNAGVANSSAYVTYYCLEKAGSIRFRVKVSGEGTNDSPYDGLKVYFNGLTDDDVILKLATTNGQWQEYELDLPPNYYTYLVFFEYFKDGSVNSGDDCAMIDDVEFLPKQDPTLNQALNYEGGSITFTTDSDYPFYVDYYQSDDVGVSGNSHANDTVSYVSCRVPMYYGDQLTFECYYDTEENYDWFDFFVNGNSYLHESGYGGWQLYTFTAFTEGIFTFTWQYQKDSSNHVGSDCVMIDNVRHIVSQEQTYSIDYSLNVTGGDLHFITGSSPTFWADFWNDDTIVTANNYGTPSTTATIRTTVTMYEGDELMFEYYVSSEENYDWFDFKVNGATEMHLSGNLGWNIYRYTAEETGEYTFLWSYTKDGSVDKYMDTVKLDNIEHFMITPHLNTALNDPETDVWLNFVSIGEYPFYVDRYDVYNLRAESSNWHVDSSYSSMTSTVSLNAGTELGFWYDLDSEQNYDWFDFYVDGTRMVHESGQIGVQYFSCTITTTGVHTFEWRYTKDSSQYAGNDSVCIYLVKVELSDGLLGDANGDGYVNANDALLILRYSLGIVGASALHLENCDVNGDGNVNANDALLVLRAALGIITL